MNMKKLLGLLLAFCLNMQAEDRLSYTLKNDTKEPITFTLRFRAQYVNRKERVYKPILMNKWQKVVLPGKQERIKHEKLNDMDLVIQDQNGEIIIDNIKPERRAIFTIYPDYTLKISQ